MERQAAPTESRKYVTLHSNSVGSVSRRDCPGGIVDGGFAKTKLGLVLNVNFLIELPGEVLVGERVVVTSVAI